MAGSFTLDLTKFAKKTNVEMRTVIQKISMEAFKRILYRTPVLTGRARANWGCQIGSFHTGTTDSTDKSGSATMAAITATASQFNGEGSIFLTNNVNYISDLENGTSRKSPQGMVGVTLQEITGMLGSKATLDSLKKSSRGIE